MESESLSNTKHEETDKAIAREEAARRRVAKLRAFNIKLNIGGSIFVIGFCILLYTVGDYINLYINVGYLGLVGLLICGFYTLKYFYLAWFVDDDDQ